MFNVIFPYMLHLRVLQLEEYDVLRFLTWIKNNFWKRNLETKKGLKWTAKAKLIFALSIVISLAFLLFLILYRETRSSASLLLIGFFLLSQPYLFLVTATILLSPFEFLVREKIKRQTVVKINKLAAGKLKVIGIAGSYGKTGVKEFLHEFLRTKYRVLRNPENRNTILAISKVVDLELDEKYDFFICEIGAYKVGDIREVCEIVKPDFGILTGINEQHLERFGRIENTTRAKFEIVESIFDVGNGRDRSLRTGRFVLANFDNELVKTHSEKHYQNFLNKNLIPYGFSQTNFSIKNIKTFDVGTTFDIILNGKAYACKTKLLGNSHLSNILAAATMANLLGVSPEQIVKVIGDLQLFPHRLEIKKLENGITLIDDAYSSNPAGFSEALKLLVIFSGPKILATPGIVELGSKNEEIHKKLGQQADLICDAVILVGKSERTKAFTQGLSKIKPIYINSVRDLWGAVESLKISNPTVLLENDLPENY